jgi:hypothetical protein
MDTAESRFLAMTCETRESWHRNRASGCSPSSRKTVVTISSRASIPFIFHRVEVGGRWRMPHSPNSGRCGCGFRGPPDEGMVRMRGVALVVGFLPALAHGLGAQEVVPPLSLSPGPRFEIGSGGLELHRVQGAAFLPGGNLAIADGGNHRILLFSPNGELIRQLGRQGDGPGEFRFLAGLYSAGDTLVAYDAMLARVSLWEQSGSSIRTVNLPKVDDRPVSVAGVLSSDQYVATSTVLRGMESRAGLYLDSASVLRVEGTGHRAAELARVEWEYTYLHVRSEGDIRSSTSYATPFLGRTQVAASPGAVAIVPRGGASVEVLDGAGHRIGGIRLPVESLPLTRELIGVYVDSLVAGAQGSGGGLPGAEARIRMVFGRSFPLPRNERAPAVTDLRTAGTLLWIRHLASPGEPLATWFLADPREPRLVGSLRLPRDWGILGGSDGEVVILRKDGNGVEHVAVYELELH